MMARLCGLMTLAVMLFIWSSGQASLAAANEAKIRAAIAQSVRTIGYEVTDRPFGNDEQVVSLEGRDAEAYKPSTRMFVRLRSVRAWRRSAATHFRYWLFREAYDTEERAEDRVKQYLANYEERLATPEMSSHMISKTIIRVGVRRRGAVVYMLVTDGAYTLFDDKNREKILSAILKAKNA
ncbi:MAG TPA: hypothetical protein VM911_13235 [Pyrinomonadaceae bacterium]|nr:hypothetical protein [Pyrinomonadaceae bacterium]